MLAADLVGGAADVAFGYTGGPTGSISGSVFATVSAANCDSHEAATSLADIRVQLLDEAGAVLEERLTDEQGAYRFADLIPGQYAVRQLSQNALLAGASLAGVSQVGDGGGIAFDANLVGEIVVQAGETLGGYDFCEFTSGIEPSGPIDRPIVPHDNNDIDQVVPYLAQLFQSISAEQPQIFAEPRGKLTTDTPLAVSAPLQVKRSAETYGGSSQTLKDPAEIKAWDEFPLDGYFSTAGFLEIAEAILPTVESFEPIIREPHLSETDDTGSDAHLADGFTTDSTEWREIDAPPERHKLVGDVEILDPELESATVATVPKIARLRKIN